jgi:hypothetical protein
MLTVLAPHHESICPSSSGQLDKGADNAQGRGTPAMVQAKATREKERLLVRAKARGWDLDLG